MQIKITYSSFELWTYEVSSMQNIFCFSKNDQATSIEPLMDLSLEDKNMKEIITIIKNYLPIKLVYLTDVSIYCK